jgi:uncharacterized protein YqkB
MKNLTQKTMIDQIETVEDAYALANDEARKEYDEDLCKSSDGIAYKELRLIIRAANQDDTTGEEFVPVYGNTSQKKWFPIFNLSSGFGFDCSAYRYDGTGTIVGSRLCSRSKEISDKIAIKFLSKYQKFITK